MLEARGISKEAEEEKRKQVTCACIYKYMYIDELSELLCSSFPRPSRVCIEGSSYSFVLVKNCVCVYDRMHRTFNLYENSPRDYRREKLLRGNVTVNRQYK